MLKTEKRTIDGAEYSLMQLPARRAATLFYKLSGAVGPALGKLASGMKGGVSFGDLDISSIGDAVGVLVERLPPADFDAAMTEMLFQLRRDGKPIVDGAAFDAAMSGQVLTILKIYQFAFELNFADFFSALRGKQAEAAQQIAAATQAAKEALSAASST